MGEVEGWKPPAPEKFTWTCDERAAPRDVALLYRADAAKDIAHLFRVTSNAWEDEHFSKPGETEWWCDCELLLTPKHPILLWDVRQRTGLRNWHALQMNFNGTSFEISPAEWRELVPMSHPLDRSVIRAAGGL